MSSLSLSFTTLINLWHHFCATCPFGVGEQWNARLLLFESTFTVCAAVAHFYFVLLVRIDSIVPVLTLSSDFDGANIMTS